MWKILFKYCLKKYFNKIVILISLSLLNWSLYWFIILLSRYFFTSSCMSSAQGLTVFASRKTVKNKGLQIIKCWICPGFALQKLSFSELGHTQDVLCPAMLRMPSLPDLAKQTQEYRQSLIFGRSWRLQSNAIRKSNQFKMKPSSNWIPIFQRGEAIWSPPTIQLTYLSNETL